MKINRLVEYFIVCVRRHAVHRRGSLPECTVNEKIFLCVDCEDRKLHAVRIRDVPWQKAGAKSQNTTLVRGEETKWLYIGKEEFDGIRQNFFLEYFLNFCKPTDPQPQILVPILSSVFI